MGGGGTAEKYIKIKVPSGTKIYSGKAAPQIGNKKPFENILEGGS